MKILAGFVEDGRHSGIDKYLLRFLDCAKTEGHTVDFLTSVYDAAFAKELEEKDSRLFAVPNLKAARAQERAVREILKKGGYDLYYHNVSEPLNYPAAKAAKSAGVPVYWHSHSSGVDRAGAADRLARRLINALCRGKTRRFSDRRFACSDRAAGWMFPKKTVRAGDFEILYNAVEFDRFSFSPGLREETRKKEKWENRKVLLFIGHFCYQKNNFFLLDVLREIKKTEPDALLVCAGTGADLAAFEEAAAERGLSGSVCTLGVRRDTPALYAAADAFLLPSRFEGLPIVSVEAQVAGLPVLLSDRITRMAAVTDRARFLPLSSALWAEELQKALALPRTPARIEAAQAEKFDAKKQKQQWIEKVFS